MLHLFRWDASAVAVPPRGNPLGAKYKLGAWTCVMCHGLLAHIVYWDLDHADDCPGWVEPAPPNSWLGDPPERLGPFWPVARRAARPAGP